MKASSPMKSMKAPTPMKSMKVKKGGKDSNQMSLVGERRMRTMARMLKNLICLWRSGAKSMEDSKQQ